MVPVGNVAPASDVRHDEVVLGIVAIREPQLLDRPAPEVDRRPLHVLVPAERAVMLAFGVVRKIGFAAVEEDDVVVAARGGAAAPFLYGIADELSVPVELVHRLHP